MPLATFSADPAALPSLPELCIGYVDYPDGTTGPGCPDTPIDHVAVVCTEGERWAGPCCRGHLKALLIGPIIGRPPTDPSGHRLYLDRSAQ